MDSELEFDPLLVDCKLILSRSELFVDDGLIGWFGLSDNKSIDSFVGDDIVNEVFLFHIGDVFVWESIDRGLKDKFRARKKKII